MNNIEQNKEEKKNNDKLSSIILLTIIITVFGGWIAYEHFVWDTFSQEGRMKMLTVTMEKVQLECIIQEGVPNNFYTGDIKVTNRVVIESPLLSVMNLGKTGLSTDQKFIILKVLFDKIEKLPCYPEVSKKLDGKTLEQHFREQVGVDGI